MQISKLFVPLAAALSVLGASASSSLACSDPPCGPPPGPDKLIEPQPSADQPKDAATPFMGQ
jgi:hypothetical protein